MLLGFYYAKLLLLNIVDLRGNMKKIKEYFSFNKKTLLIPIFIIIIFYGVAFWRYFATGAVFYIINFCYIGTALAIGIFIGSTLKKEYADWGRRITQLLIGIYMLVFLGFIMGENMQIEGFFLYLMLGIFAGATLHYFIAKIAGVTLFGRGWCGYACWTAMVLDFLPWKTNKKGRIRKLGVLRYIHFFIALGLSLTLWFSTENKETLFTHNSGNVEIIWLIIGNIIYYTIGIILASVLKDNRAFCKYVCPIPTLMKIGSRFSLMKIKIDDEKCIDCKKCEKACLMDIKLLDYHKDGKRILSTECIQCSTCVRVCPTDAISTTFSIDCGFKEKLNYKEKK